MLRALELDRKRLKIIRLTGVLATTSRAADRQIDCYFGALGVRHAVVGRKLGIRMRGTFARNEGRSAAAVGAILLALALGLAGCSGETFQRGYVLPDGALEQIPLGASQEQVLLVLGTPSTVATVSGEAFYYISQKDDRPIAFMQGRVTDQRVIAVYFDRDRKVQRLAEYGIKDGKVFDFVSRTTPTSGNDLNVITTILHNLQGKGS
jgi:outer membrane protein assembly factor BamE (lipoprotein component of BamABCDE complex)